MPKIIGAKGMEVLQAWVDVSYAIYKYMKGHTGCVMSAERGIVQGKATRQKLSIKSSNKSEVFGASDYIPWIVWTFLCVKEQGYVLKRNLFYQDNKSAMKLESKGKNMLARN